MVVNDVSTTRSSPVQTVEEVDLTGEVPLPQLPFMRIHQARSSPRSFNAAVRRVYTRRERLYDRASPGVMRERLDMAEECPQPELHPARESALSHLSRAYAVAGYAQAALCVVVAAVLVAFITSFARGLLADVARKTRQRAGDSVRAAAICARNFKENSCATVNADDLTPALKNLCLEWQECIARGDSAEKDAISATVWAEAAAETVNAFAERISSTSIVIGLMVAVVLAFFMSSAAFGFMHRRLVDDRLVQTATTPPPVVHARNEDQFSSPYRANGLRPRAITFDRSSTPPLKGS